MTRHNNASEFSDYDDESLNHNLKKEKKAANFSLILQVLLDF